MGKEALRDGLKTVKLCNVRTVEGMKVCFAGGVLEMHCAYARGTTGRHCDTDTAAT